MVLNTLHFYLNVLLSTKFVIEISATADPQNENMVTIIPLTFSNKNVNFDEKTTMQMIF